MDKGNSGRGKQVSKGREAGGIGHVHRRGTSQVSKAWRDTEREDVGMGYWNLMMEVLEARRLDSACVHPVSVCDMAYAWPEVRSNR